MTYADLYPADPQAFAQLHFGAAPLGDPRRQRRAVTLAAALAAAPGESLPRLFAGSSYALNAAYDLCKRPEATPERVHGEHRALVREAMSRPGRTSLLVQDGSEFSWPATVPIEGLGPVGDAKSRAMGFDLHSTMAVAWPERDGGEGRRPPVEVLGLAHQQFVIRPRRAGKTVRGGLMGRLWERSVAAVGPAPEGVRWVDIADAGADIFDFLRACTEAGHGFVVRAARDRVLEDPATGKRRGKLFAAARRGRRLGTMTLDLRARGSQPARTATLSLRASQIAVRSTARPGRAAGSEPPLSLWAVHVLEDNAPAGVKPLEWILLCSEPATAPEAAREAVRMYATRWIVEEFHKGLKSGLGAERLQLETAGRLFAAIAVMSVVALRLLDLREKTRATPECEAAAAGLDELSLRVLAHRTKRRLATVRDVALALGALGGHLGRKGDGLPGWRSLWHGWVKLDGLVQGVHIAEELRRSQE